MLRATAISLALAASLAVAAPTPQSTTAANPDVDINAAIPEVVAVNTRGEDAELIAKLLSVATNADRAALLDQPGDFVFDFTYDKAPKSALSKGDGGATISANARTFPALIGTGSAMTVGELGPCGFNTPHVHNRATELNIMVHGRLVTNFITENRVKPVENTMTQWQMSVFPQGAIHGEYNPVSDLVSTLRLVPYANICQRTVSQQCLSPVSTARIPVFHRLHRTSSHSRTSSSKPRWAVSTPSTERTLRRSETSFLPMWLWALTAVSSDAAFSAMRNAVLASREATKHHGSKSRHLRLRTLRIGHS